MEEAEKGKDDGDNEKEMWFHFCICSVDVSEVLQLLSITQERFDTSNELNERVGVYP